MFPISTKPGATFLYRHAHLFRMLKWLLLALIVLALWALAVASLGN